jgi:hypothetical protein
MYVSYSYREATDGSLGCYLQLLDQSCMSCGTMNNQNERGRDLLERIVSLIRANQQARKTPITDEELHKLSAAARRLDQMLQVGVDEDQQTLKTAAARLDQFLKDIAAGKDISNNLKRRRSN